MNSQSTLHLIQRSPFSNSALTNCLNIIAKEDVILLMEDGVYSVQHKNLQTIGNTLYALKNDMSARGLNNKNSHSNADNPIHEIDYTRFVELCTQHTHIISWY